jgi:hypothetical protein
VKRMVTVVGAIVGLIAVSVPVGSAAVSAADSALTGLITFDDAAQQVTLTVPTPACAPDHEGCKWVLFVNEPKVAGEPVVGSETGTTGVLTVKYPPDFCGVLQADARTGPPYVQVLGLLHTVKGSNCSPTPTSTTTTSSTTTTTTSGPVPGSQPPTPPSAAAAAVSPADGPVGATSTGPTSEPAAAGTSAPVSATPTQLPFTGANVRPFLFVGLTLVAVGAFLLTTRISRRRMARRVGDLPWPLAGGLATHKGIAGRARPGR